MSGPIVGRTSDRLYHHRFYHNNNNHNNNNITPMDRPGHVLIGIDAPEPIPVSADESKSCIPQLFPLQAYSQYANISTP